jgi:hypothetical protein
MIIACREEADEEMDPVGMKASALFADFNDNF